MPENRWLLEVIELQGSCLVCSSDGGMRCAADTAWRRACARREIRRAIDSSLRGDRIAHRPSGRPDAIDPIDLIAPIGAINRIDGGAA